MFAWNSYEKGVDIHLQADPTRLELLTSEVDKKKTDFKVDHKKSILEKYGGQEHLEAPPKQLLLAQTVTLIRGFIFCYFPVYFLLFLCFFRYFPFFLPFPGLFCAISCLFSAVSLFIFWWFVVYFCYFLVVFCYFPVYFPLFACLFSAISLFIFCYKIFRIFSDLYYGFLSQSMSFWKQLEMI